MWYPRPEIHAKNSNRQNRPENSHAKVIRDGVGFLVSVVVPEDLQLSRGITQ